MYLGYPYVPVFATPRAPGSSPRGLRRAITLSRKQRKIAGDMVPVLGLSFSATGGSARVIDCREADVLALTRRRDVA